MISRSNIGLAFLWTFAIAINSVLAWQGSKVALATLIFLCVCSSSIMLFLFELNNKLLNGWKETLNVRRY